MTQESSPADILTSKQVCEILQVSAKTLQRLRNKRAISFIRAGGGYRYRRIAVDRYIANREVRVA